MTALVERLEDAARSTLLSVGGNSSSRSQMSSARDQSLAPSDAEPSAEGGGGQ